MVSKRAQAAGFHMHHRRRVTVPLGEWHSSHVGTSYIKPSGGVSGHLSQDGGRRAAAEGHHEKRATPIGPKPSPPRAVEDDVAREDTSHRWETLFC